MSYLVINVYLCVDISDESVGVGETCATPQSVPPPMVYLQSFDGQSDQHLGSKIDQVEVPDVGANDGSDALALGDIYLCIAKFANSANARSG